jgi:hypothetical protein
LSGLTTAVVAVKGHYDSEILLAQTMRTIQKQMRASRNAISAHITARMALDIADYPLSAAMGDLEDYYRAGTLTSGVIDASTTVGEEEKRLEEKKQVVAQLPAAARRAAILADANLPIPTPVVLPVTTPGGTGFAEQRLFGARLNRLQRFVCAPQSDDFTPPVRAAVIKRLVTIGKKDTNSPDRITDTDENTVRRELRINPPACN